MHQRGVRVWILAAGLVTILPGGAVAQFTIEQGASILVFPKVAVDAATDTVVQIANQSMSPVYGRCLYVSRGVTDSGTLPASGAIAADFQINLVPAQPTYWVASRGRQQCLHPPNDPNCAAGFSLTQIPAAPSDFHGELLCIETDAVGEPISGNDLIGKATVQDITTGDLASYNAIGVPGLPTNDGDNVLCLGGESSETCPSGAEYAACPQTWALNHLADGAEDPIAGAGSSVATSVTVVPCSQDLTAQEPQPVTLQFTTTNEIEQTFSVSTTVQGSTEVALSAISPMFERGSLGTDYAQTTITPDTSSGGFMLLAETLRRTNGTDMLATSTTLNLHTEGAETAPEVIVLPGPPAP
jgi:hypothetical protein